MATTGMNAQMAPRSTLRAPWRVDIAKLKTTHPLAASAEGVGHPAAHERGEVVDGDVGAESAVAVRVRERRDGAEHPDGHEFGRHVGNLASELAGFHEPPNVVEVHPGALGEDVGNIRVGSFDVEQREVGGVVGHESHAGLGAVGDPRHCVRAGIHRCALGAAEAQPHRAHQFGEQRTLGGEVPVEEPLGDTGRLADVGDAGRSVAAGGEELARSIEQLLLAFEPVFGVLSFVVKAIGVDGAHRDSPTHA